jgi:hypothetical protein
MKERKRGKQQAEKQRPEKINNKNKNKNKKIIINKYVEGK